MFIVYVVVWVAFLPFLLVRKLVCYTHVFPCMHTCTCTLCIAQICMHIVVTPFIPHKHVYACINPHLHKARRNHLDIGSVTRIPPPSFWGLLYCVGGL